MPTLVKNKKVTFDYEILDTFDAGAELLGSEVKSLRAGHGKLEGGHVVVRGGEAFLVGASIQPYQPGNTNKSYDPERPRRLLLTHKELDELIGIDAAKGLTLVPISWYTSRRFIKLKFASVRGKKKYDKRETIKERDTKRDMSRLMKQQRG
jgi:SsrA-binding protein